MTSETPTKRIESLGAGVQSTAMFILGCQGELLPKLDAAVFADTQWEPEHVNEHLDRLVQYGEEHGVPVIRASKGSLPDDVLDPSVFATLPAWTLDTDTELVPTRFATCPTCQGGDGWQGSIEGDPFSCFDCQDARLIAVEWEKRPRRVTKGKVKRQCTPKYKVEVIDREVRVLLGANRWQQECRYCEGTGRRIPPWERMVEDHALRVGMTTCSICRGTGVRQRVGSVPAGVWAEQWIGFSTDEIERVSDTGFPSYSRPRFPLLELRWSRTRCEQFLHERGWQAEKSACIGCPFHDDDIWIEMKHRDPKEFERAADFDERFRTAPGLNAQRFIHEARIPLREAVEKAERERAAAGVQEPLWGEIPRRRPRGCSPYGCRTAEAIEYGDEEVVA